VIDIHPPLCDTSKTGTGKLRLMNACEARSSKVPVTLYSMRITREVSTVKRVCVLPNTMAFGLAMGL